MTDGPAADSFSLDPTPPTGHSLNLCRPPTRRWESPAIPASGPHNLLSDRQNLEVSVALTTGWCTSLVARRAFLHGTHGGLTAKTSSCSTHSA